MEKPPLTVVDLFCGAGGMSLGFLEAGFDIVYAADRNTSAIETYDFNFAHEAHHTDIQDIPVLPSSSVFLGGPPCQGFSSAGARRSGDPRNSLVGLFARIVAAHRPHAFVFENVEGFLTGDGGAHVLELLEPLIAAGYRIHLRKVNAANYGVPQLRKRVLAIGGLGWDPTFPLPTHAAFGAPGAALEGRHLPLCPTVANAIGDLPLPGAVVPGVPQGHTYKPLPPGALMRAERLTSGMTMRDLPEALQHKSFRRRSARRVSDGTPSSKRGGAPAGIRRLAGSEPSKAITGGAGTEFLHPVANRTLTLRECARLQTFPDTFTFRGSVSEQALLVGNAVPPLLARRIGEQLRADLEEARPSRKPGALLSFAPTVSGGRSPALQQMSEMVASRIGFESNQETLPFVFI